MQVKELLQNNRTWAETINRERPDFFPKLANQQPQNFCG